MDDKKKQKFLDFISKSIDEGFMITISSFSSKPKEEAIKLAAELCSIINEPIGKEDYKSSQSYQVGNVHSQIRGQFFYGSTTLFLEEDVDLSGEDDIAI